jgi:hypothetical protein
MSKASDPQPRPVKGFGAQVVFEIVIEDVRERSEVGRVRYGTPLMTFNGRDALWDAYQEAIDLVMYLRQVILEREATPHDHG